MDELTVPQLLVFLDHIKKTPPLNLVASEVLDAFARRADDQQREALGKLGAVTEAKPQKKRGGRVVGMMVKKTGQTLIKEAGKWPKLDPSE